MRDQSPITIAEVNASAYLGGFASLAELAADTDRWWSEGTANADAAYDRWCAEGARLAAIEKEETAREEAERDALAEARHDAVLARWAAEDEAEERLLLRGRAS